MGGRAGTRRVWTAEIVALACDCIVEIVMI